MEDLGLKDLFGGVYAGRRVLVTGHTGFKGSWLALWLNALGADVSGIGLDPDTDPAHWDLVRPDIDERRIDIRDAKAVGDAFDALRPEIVFHLAAQPLVRRAYAEPVLTYQVNVLGHVNVLEAIRACPSVAVVVHATTDKVYEPKTTINGYTEDDPLGGHDPYSTSKASSELISASYRSSYFEAGGERTVRLATARAGNVIGGGDWATDRLVPDLVKAAIANEPLHVRNPNATRPWQHVLEPLSGYLQLGRALLGGDVEDRAWNFGPAADATLSVWDVITIMRAHWPHLRVERDAGPHPHEASDLRLDATRAAQHLDWRPVWNADATMSHTARWYREYSQSGRVLSRDDLAAYVADAKNWSLGWTR